MTSFFYANASIQFIKIFPAFVFYQEENDNEYEAEPEIADEFDSDFNEDVSV